MAMLGDPSKLTRVQPPAADKDSIPAEIIAQNLFDRSDLEASLNTSLKRLAILNRGHIPRENSQSSRIAISNDIFERNRELPKSRSGENKSFQSIQTIGTVEIDGKLFTLDRKLTVHDRRVEFLGYHLHSEEEGEIASFKWEGSTNYHRFIVEDYRGRGLSGSLIRLGEELLVTSGEKSLRYRADGIENICWGIAHDYYPDEIDIRRLVQVALDRGWGGESHLHESVGIKCILVKVSA